MTQQTKGTANGSLIELLKKGPVCLLEFRSEHKEFREWTDKNSGKARSMAVATWRCETTEGQQGQVAFFGNSLDDLPSSPYKKGDNIIVVAERVTEDKDVLSIRCKEHMKAEL